MPRGRAVGFRHGTASAQFGPGALRLQPLHQCLDVAWQVGSIGGGCHVVHPPGGLFMQVLPAVEPQLGLPASIQLPTPVSLVSLCFVGYAPQEGWLLVLRSASGSSGLCGLRPAVTSFPLSWAFPTAES